MKKPLKHLPQTPHGYWLAGRWFLLYLSIQIIQTDDKGWGVA